MGGGLENADDAPAERAQHFPPPQSVPIDAAGRRLFVGVDEVVDESEPAHREHRPEPPGLLAQPPEVLQGVADVGQFPIQHGPDPVGAHDEVAVPEVPVHHNGLVPWWWPIGEEPAKPQFESRVRLPQVVGQVPQLLEGVTTDQLGHGTGRDPVDGGQDLTALAGQTGPNTGQPLVTEDPSGNGLSLHELDDHKAGAEAGVDVTRSDHRRDGHPGGGGSSEQPGLESHARGGNTGWVAAQDIAPRRVPGAARREAPRLSRGATGEDGEITDHHSGPEHRLEHVTQLRLEFATRCRRHAGMLPTDHHRRSDRPAPGQLLDHGDTRKWRGIGLAIALRLEPRDEYTHELGPELNFNESMYFNFFDPERHIGGFFRLGNRANERVGEVTTCIFLPDGRVAFMFRRPEVTTNDAFEAGGMHFEVVEPFVELHVSYDGDVVLLDDPLEMADPKAAFTSHQRLPCAVGLSYRATAPVVGGEPESPSERPGEEFARGHYEQLMSASGTIAVDAEHFEVNGFGLRDHSWGPRHWQAPWYYRWLTASFGAGFGFMGSHIARRDGDGIRSGFVWDGAELHFCDDVRIRSEWDGDGYHRLVRAELVAGERHWKVLGTVLSLVPLRNRRTGPDGEQLVTRISEGLTRWQLDGAIGYGLSEYLDQIVEGRPVGLDE